MKRIAMGVLLSLLFCNGSNANREPALALRLELTTTTSALCFLGPLKVQATLVNKSNEKVAVDVKSIWYQISFNFFRGGLSQTNRDGSGSGRNSGGSLTKVGNSGPNYEGAYLILNPGESYTENRTIRLDDKLFRNPGDYKMKVTYGQFLDKSFENITVWKGSIGSNDLRVKVADCRKTKPKSSGRPSFHAK